MIKEGSSSQESTPATTIVSSRRRFNYEQTEILLNEFQQNRNPDKIELQAITTRILPNKNSITDFKRVNQWYQNRRARENKKRWLRIKNLVTDDDSISSQFTSQLDHNEANWQVSETEQSSIPSETVLRQDIKTALETVTQAFGMIYDDTTTEILIEFQREFLNALHILYTTSGEYKR